MTTTTTAPVIHALQDLLLTQTQPIESALPQQLHFNRKVLPISIEVQCRVSLDNDRTDENNRPMLDDMLDIDWEEVPTPDVGPPPPIPPP